jgi:hypothetical protein
MRVAVLGDAEQLLYIHGFLKSEKAITMKINFSKCTWVFSLLAMTLFVSQAVMAQDEGRTKLDWGDWPGSVSVGAGIRTSYNTGDPIGDVNDFNIDNARLYVNATGHDILGLELNFDINNAQGPGSSPDEFRILDAILKIEFGDLVNIWMGRMLPPSDRNNLSGPFYQNSWAFPYTQFGYHNIFQGRDDGIMVHGSFREGSVEYALGVYDGPDATADAEMMVAGRFSVNLLDNEEGYYNASTYHGTKELLTLGFAFQNQQDSTGAGGDEYDAYNFDLLYERPTSSGGVVTVEGAWYSFEGTASTDTDGDSYFLLVSYMLSSEYSLGALTGRVVPYYRHQEYTRDTNLTAPVGGVAGDLAVRSNDWGIHYVIHGHNARLTMEYSDTDTDNATQIDSLKLGMQLQF